MTDVGRCHTRRFLVSNTDSASAWTMHGTSEGPAGHAQPTLTVQAGDAVQAVTHRPNSLMLMPMLRGTVDPSGQC